MTRLLIIRLSAIGDVIMASPIVEALRAKHPGVHIAWLVQPEARDLIVDHPGLDQVIVWPRNTWLTLWKERRWYTLSRTLLAFRRQLRANQFDACYDLQGLLKSALLAWLSGAPVRIGLGSREGGQWFMTSRVTRTGDTDDLIGSEYRRFAQHLGLATEPFPMAIAISPVAQTNADEILRAQGVQNRYGVICPFTTRPQKHWPAQHWQELVPTLLSDWVDKLVMLGGPGDTAAAADLGEASRLVNLVGQTQLQEAAAIIRGAHFLIGVDTGLTHLGTAFEIPTVALFGSTCPYLKTDSKRTRVIYHALHCSPCRRRPTCQERFDCMRDISTPQVLTALQQVLSAT